MNKYFDNQDEPERTRYEQKVFDMVKGIDVEFGKKKKKKEDRLRWRNHLSPPFLSRSSRDSSSTCRTGRS